MKVRIAVAVDEAGRWSAAGDSSLSYIEARSDVLQSVETPARFFWIEADLPDPAPEPVVRGTVSEDGTEEA